MADNGEIECLSDAKGMTCAQCRRCNGLRSHQLHNVFINVHGAGLAGPVHHHHAQENTQ